MCVNAPRPRSTSRSPWRSWGLSYRKCLHYMFVGIMIIIIIIIIMMVIMSIVINIIINNIIVI